MDVWVFILLSVLKLSSIVSLFVPGVFRWWLVELLQIGPCVALTCLCPFSEPVLIFGPPKMPKTSGHLVFSLLQPWAQSLLYRVSRTRSPLLLCAHTHTYRMHVREPLCVGHGAWSLP